MWPEPTRGFVLVPYLACMTLVASLYHLPPRVLPAIQGVEGGRPGTMHRNTDGTLDLGVMQINTRWLQPLMRYTRTQGPVVFRRLRDDACYNIAAAGAIMRGNLDASHGNLLRAVGDYHSHTVQLNLAYRTQVLRVATMLFTHPPTAVGDEAMRRNAAPESLRVRSGVNRGRPG